MTDWIEINLPWRSYNNPDLPELNMEDTKTKALEESFCKDFSCDSPHLFILDKKIEIQKRLIAAGLRPSECFDMATDEIESSNEPYAIRYREIKKSEDDFLEWRKSQPEYISWQDECDRIHDEADKKPKESFCGKCLNKAGTLIEVIVAGNNRQFLIGNINEHAGVCDDCVEFGYGTIVTRYKVIWEKETQ